MHDEPHHECQMAELAIALFRTVKYAKALEKRLQVVEAWMARQEVDKLSIPTTEPVADWKKIFPET
jgi:hypothetical protein